LPAKYKNMTATKQQLNVTNAPRYSSIVGKTIKSITEVSTRITETVHTETPASGVGESGDYKRIVEFTDGTKFEF
jgi:hypothetical protein